MFGDRGGLIALDRANVVPDNRQIARGDDFRQRFLEIAFTKIMLPGCKGLSNGAFWLALADSQQGRGVPGIGLCGLFYAATNDTEIVLDGVHGVGRPIEYLRRR